MTLHICYKIGFCKHFLYIWMILKRLIAIFEVFKNLFIVSNLKLRFSFAFFAFGAATLPSIMDIFLKWNQFAVHRHNNVLINWSVDQPRHSYIVEAQSISILRIHMAFWNLIHVLTWRIWVLNLVCILNTIFSWNDHKHHLAALECMGAGCIPLIQYH